MDDRARWCAYCTASQTLQNSSSRASTFSARSSQKRSIGVPSTYSITKYGRPSRHHAAVEQPRDAGMLERREDLPLVAGSDAQDVARCPCRARTSLSATRCRKAPSSRSARYTTPMPPAPRLADDPVRADARAGRGKVRRRERQRDERRRLAGDRLLEEVLGRSQARSSCSTCSRRSASPLAAALEKADALLRRQVERGVEHALDLVPALEIGVAHVASPGFARVRTRRRAARGRASPSPSPSRGGRSAPSRPAPPPSRPR